MDNGSSLVFPRFSLSLLEIERINNPKPRKCQFTTQLSFVGFVPKTNLLVGFGSQPFLQLQFVPNTSTSTTAQKHAEKYTVLSHFENRSKTLLRSITKRIQIQIKRSQNNHSMMFGQRVAYTKAEEMAKKLSLKKGRDARVKSAHSSSISSLGSDHSSLLSPEDKLLEGVESTLDMRTKRYEDLQKQLVVQTQRARSRMAVNNTVGAILSMKKVKSIQSELQRTASALEYLQHIHAQLRDFMELDTTLNEEEEASFSSSSFVTLASFSGWVNELQSILDPQERQCIPSDQELLRELQTLSSNV